MHAAEVTPLAVKLSLKRCSINPLLILPGALHETPQDSSNLNYVKTVLIRACYMLIARQFLSQVSRT